LELFRADGLFVGFAAPPTGGEVRLYHEPDSVRLGAALSLLGLTAFAVLARWPRGAKVRPLPGFLAASVRPAVHVAVIAAPALVIVASWALDVGGARSARREHDLRAAALRSWTEEAHAAYRAGALVPAANLLQRAASLSPRDAQVQYRLGLVEKARGRSTTARAAFRRALSLDPNLTAARSALAELDGAEANTENP
jgi:tetratricopeptide (TPR) repeat protein